jgi:hypothetical protein
MTASISHEAVPCDIQRIFAEVKSLAGQLTEDASDLVSYSRGTRSWESHLGAVNRFNEHVDAAGFVLQKAEVVRRTASHLQQSTLDQVGPLLSRIASGMARVIRAIDENPKRLLVGEYRDLIESNSDYASQFAALITAFIDFGGRPPVRRPYWTA